MAKRREIRNSTAEFLIFQAEAKEQGVEVYYKDENIVSVSDVTPCKINDDCLHCCPSVRQQFTVLA